MKKFIALILSILIMLPMTGCNNESSIAAAEVNNNEVENNGENTDLYFGTLKPVIETKVVSKGKGQILECNFEVGDSVTEGSLLYTIDDNGLADTIEITKNSIEKSNIAISSAQENVSNLKIYAPASGILKNFNIKEKERVNSAKIADIYDESKVIALVPFNEAQIKQISIGDIAVVTSSDLMSSVNGKVTRIYDEKLESTTGAVLHNLEITISNAGSLYKGLCVSAKITNKNGTLSSPDIGIIENSEPVSVVSRTSGNVKNVYAKEGQYVKNGELLVELENSGVTSVLSRALLDKSDLEIKLASLVEKYNELFVYAPASGIITSKTKSVNDNITSNSESIMTISDITTLTMNLNVSEDILKKIHENMEVKIDLPDEELKTVNGTIYEINKNNNEVKIKVDNTGGIKPGAIASVNFGGN